jgi:hypothetical protein
MGKGKKREPISSVAFEVWVSESPISRFSYPDSTTKADKTWSKSDGIQIAACCKAILGKIPFQWPRRDSAEYVASCIEGARVIVLVDGFQFRELRRHVS